MIRKAALTITLGTFIIGCGPVVVDSYCDISRQGGSLYIETNTYQDIEIEAYEVLYEDGVLLKEFQRSQTIPYLYNARSTGERGKQAAVFSEICDAENDEFSSFLLVAHLDENSTYTIAGFTESMDNEYNITAGQKADIYGVGYIQNSTYYSGSTDYHDWVSIDINETGHFILTEKI